MEYVIVWKEHKKEGEENIRDTFVIRVNKRTRRGKKETTRREKDIAARNLERARIMDCGRANSFCP